MGEVMRLKSKRMAIALLLIALFQPAAYAGTADALWARAYRATPSDTLLAGATADGAVYDVVLENDRTVVVISDIGHSLPYSLGGGNIIDAGTRAERLDALTEVYTYFDDVWRRQAVYDAMDIAEDGAGGGAAVVRVSGLDSKDPYLSAVTQYSLEPGADYVTISTTVVNNGSSSFDEFELGDAFAWSDCETYAPGYGFAIPDTATSAWLAASSELMSYGYAAAGMTDIWGAHGEEWSRVNVKSADLGPGESAYYERYLIVGGRDIASVATSIHRIAGAPAGSLHCSVARAADETPLLDAEISVRNHAGAPYLEMRTDSEGLAFATLPPGDWHLVAKADGYDSSDTWVSVEDHGSLSHDFIIEERKIIIPGIGDTLTVIQRPLLNIPAIVVPGSTLTIECDAHPAATGWAAEIRRGETAVPLEIHSAEYDASTLWWSLSAVVPAVPLYGLYDLAVTAAGGIEDTTKNAVQVISEFKHDYYFIHVTDPHLPTHRFYYEAGSESDSSEMMDMREVIADINIINPEFVLNTGDLINEGELEDFLNRRYYSRSQRLLTEFEVPAYLTAGNHDIGGWSSTPPSDGTARRDWWRFYGWKRLDSPPPGAPWYTQNYSFDYGPVHYVGLEAYDNYDRWRYNIYGSDSFTSGQMQWLAEDLAATQSAAQVLFYHYDFSRQINLSALGVEMALWGHIHRDSGSLSGPPYNLATNNVCDGERSYRLIRVTGSTLTPSPTISAGYDGRNLSVDFEPANNAMYDSVTAHITNDIGERFEHAMLRFKMPAGCDSVVVKGGKLVQVEDRDSYATYYVAVDILPLSSDTVSIVVDSCSSPGDTSGVESLSLAPNRPNPFNPQTSFSFTLPASGHARLAIYDIRGREVAVIVDKTLIAGPHEGEWDGRDEDLRPVSSGIYFARLTFGGEDRVQKLVLTR